MIGGACGRGGGAAAPRVAFLRKKLRKNLFQRGAILPTKIHLGLRPSSPKPTVGSYPSHFRGILFACERNPHGPSHIGKKESSLSFFPMWLGLAEKQSFSAKNDAKSSCPLEKSFCGAFFKKRPSRPQAPLDKSKFKPQSKEREDTLS